MQFHAVYMNRRQPGTSYRDFQRLWRSHGDFAATVPAFWDNVDRYIHNDPVEDVTGVPNHNGDYDAIGELFYTSYETWVSMRDVMWNEIAPDEKRVFPGPSQAVRGGRTIYKQPDGLVKLFTFAKFRAGIASETIDATLAAHAHMSLKSPEFGQRLSGFTVTRARPNHAASQMDSKPQTASSRDVVFIHFFKDDATARAALASADYVRIQASEDTFLDFDSRLVVLAHGWVLKGEQG